MPNETVIDNKGTGAGGDDAAAKAAADKAAAGSGGEETVTIKKTEHEKLQSDLKQSNEDRDNYKTGLLKKKADERDLKGDQGTGDGKGGEGGGSNVIDEKKVGEVATAAANKTLRTASERTAKRSFLTAHPEYVDDVQWTALMSNLTFKGTELTHDEVVDRMEAALLEHKRSIGKLDEHLNKERERGRQEGRIEGGINAGRDAGGAGDRSGGGGEGKGTGLSEKGKEMARAMHTDPEKAAKVDLTKDNVMTTP